MYTEKKLKKPEGEMPKGTRRLELLETRKITSPVKDSDMELLRRWNRHPPKDETREEREARYAVNCVLNSRTENAVIELKNKLLSDLVGKGYNATCSESEKSESVYLYVRQKPDSPLPMKIRISEHDNGGVFCHLNVSVNDNYDNIMKKIDDILNLVESKIL